MRSKIVVKSRNANAWDDELCKLDEFEENSLSAVQHVAYPRAYP